MRRPGTLAKYRCWDLRDPCGLKTTPMRASVAIEFWLLGSVMRNTNQLLGSLASPDQVVLPTSSCCLPGTLFSIFPKGTTAKVEHGGLGFLGLPGKLAVRTQLKWGERPRNRSE